MFPSTPTENVLASNFERIDYPSSFCFASSSYSNSIIYSIPSFIALCPSILFFLPFLYNQFPSFYSFFHCPLTFHPYLFSPSSIINFLPFFPVSFCLSLPTLLFLSMYIIYFLPSIPSFIALCPSIPTFLTLPLWLISFLYNQFPAFFPFLISPFISYFAFPVYMIYFLLSIPLSLPSALSSQLFFTLPL